MKLIPHPRLSLASPLVTARELMLAATCADLRAHREALAHVVRVQAVQLCAAGELTRQLGSLIAAQEEKIRNQDSQIRNLTKALHRTARAGHALPQVVYFGALLTGCGLVHAWLGTPGILALGAGFVLGVACVLCALHTARPRRTTARRRVHPAHLDEPGVDAPRPAPLGEAYAGENFLCREDETLSRAIRHPEAEAARARFEATAAALR